MKMPTPSVQTNVGSNSRAAMTSPVTMAHRYRAACKERRAVPRLRAAWFVAAARCARLRVAEVRLAGVLLTRGRLAAEVLPEPELRREESEFRCGCRFFGLREAGADLFVFLVIARQAYRQRRSPAVSTGSDTTPRRGSDTTALVRHHPDREVSAPAAAGLPRWSR